MKQKRRHGHGRRLLEIGKDILIVFLVFQKRLMGNIHMGGLKE